MAKYRGTGVITAGDYKTVKWVGISKTGDAVTITLSNAINIGNIDWTFKEKDDTVAQIVMTATYDNTDTVSMETVEPWTVEIAGTKKPGAEEILLGAGIFYIGEKKIALSRGGGQFTVTREYRNITADGDRGPVKGRIALEGSTATLTMNVLTILGSIEDIYPAVSKSEENGQNLTENE